MFEFQKIREKEELLRWFSAEEISWLQKNRPDLAKFAANTHSGTQSIFLVRNILDKEFYCRNAYMGNTGEDLPEGLEFLDI